MLPIISPNNTNVVDACTILLRKRRKNSGEMSFVMLFESLIEKQEKQVKKQI